MLQVPDLDDITFDQLLQGAVHKIPLLTKEWTDFNRHDPGITTLETYAWLIDMLNYYMNATGKVHILKYMKLLGIAELPRQAAQAWVCVETDKDKVTLPQGFPIYAGSKCFVCENATEVADNRFKELLYENNGEITDLTSFAGEDGSYAKVFRVGSAEKETENLYLGFEKALTEDTRLFVTVKEYEERKVLPKEFRLSVLQCSCYDGKHWIPVEIAEDQTNGLLRSGVISLRIPSGMQKHMVKDGEEGYYLRLTISENHYDVTPEIGKIFLNPVKMVQKQELAKRISYRYSEETKDYEIPYYVSEKDKIAVGVCIDEKEGLYRMAYVFEEQDTDEAFVEYDKKRITFREGMEPLEGTLVDVLLIKEDVIADSQIGVTDGCAEQKLPFFVHNPYEVQLLLANVQKGQTCYQHWKYVPSLEQASYEDKVFTYDSEENSLQFGDGIHGMVPESGQTVIISECSLSDYEEGNVRAGEIKRVTDAKYGQLVAYNTAMATGGRGIDSIEKMQERLERRITEQNRVVSPADYERIVKEIPGLMIRGAKVISAQEYCRNHGNAYKPYDTYVVVCPMSMKPREKLDKKYREYICDYLEQYRLLNTRVKVVEPVYGCINMSGRIRIVGNRQTAKAEAEAFLRSYIEERQKQCSFGAVLSYGDIFMQLETLDHVERVEELHLSLGGEMGRKSDKGDILLNSDCLPYVGELEFEYKE